MTLFNLWPFANASRACDSANLTQQSYLCRAAGKTKFAASSFPWLDVSDQKSVTFEFLLFAITTIDALTLPSTKSLCNYEFCKKGMCCIIFTCVCYFAAIRHRALAILQVGGKLCDFGSRKVLPKSSEVETSKTTEQRDAKVVEIPCKRKVNHARILEKGRVLDLLVSPDPNPRYPSEPMFSQVQATRTRCQVERGLVAFVTYAKGLPALVQCCSDVHPVLRFPVLPSDLDPGISVLPPCNHNARFVCQPLDFLVAAIVDQAALIASCLFGNTVQAVGSVS